jgi:hypothetical protein
MDGLAQSPLRFLGAVPSSLSWRLLYLSRLPALALALSHALCHVTLACTYS